MVRFKKEEIKWRGEEGPSGKVGIKYQRGWGGRYLPCGVTSLELHTLGSRGVDHRHAALHTGLSWKHPPLVDSPCIQGPLDQLRVRIKACQGRDQCTSVSILILDINTICAVCLGELSLTLLTSDILLKKMCCSPFEYLGIYFSSFGWVEEQRKNALQ